MEKQSLEQTMSGRKNMIKPEVTRKTQEVTRKLTREELAKQIRKMKDRDSELVTGIFKNLENPGSGGSRGSLVFSYKAYPGEENTIYELWDGERYSLPRGVARHLNNSCFYREYSHLQGEHGTQGLRGGSNADGKLNTSNMQMSKKIHRYAFHSLEFMDDDVEMRPSNLTEVTVSP